MIKFKVNRYYGCMFDDKMKWICKVIKRTNKSIWIYGFKRIKRRKINIYNNIERVYLLGIFPICPILLADQYIRVV